MVQKYNKGVVLNVIFVTDEPLIFDQFATGHFYLFHRTHRQGDFGSCPLDFAPLKDQYPMMRGSSEQEINKGFYFAIRPSKTNGSELIILHLWMSGWSGFRITLNSSGIITEGTSVPNILFFVKMTFQSQLFHS
jgi:hypothetical protein